MSKGRAFATKNTMLHIVARVLIARQHDLCRTGIEAATIRTPVYRAKVDYGRRAMSWPNRERDRSWPKSRDASRDCYWHECAVLTASEIVCFSNRPFGVKHFQTIHDSVDVTRGPVLLFGIGTKALPSWDSKTR
jgi:hypothetical protein